MSASAVSCSFSFFVERSDVLTRLHVAFGILFATVVYEQYRWIQFRKEYLQVVEILKIESEANEYLLELFNKYDLPVDEFEMIALKYHHINTLDAAEEE